MTARTQWTLIVAIVVAAFALPALIWLSAVVGIVIILVGLAFWAAMWVRLSAPGPAGRPANR
jgi:hypothetical protein